MADDKFPEDMTPEKLFQHESIKVIHVDVEAEDVKVKGDDKQGGESDQKEGKKGSVVWDYFVKIKGCTVGNEKAQCSLCKVIIQCNTSRNGTSVTFENSVSLTSLRNNLDKMQKILQFVKLSKDDKFHTIKAHTFIQERLKKKFALMCIKDNQPFRIVEHEGFRELMNEAEPKFKMPSGWTVARDCLKIYKDELVKVKKAWFMKEYHSQWILGLQSEI